MALQWRRLQWRYSGGVEDAGGLRGGTGACGTATGADDRSVEMQAVTPAIVGEQIRASATQTVLALAGPHAMPPAGGGLRL